MKRISKPSPAMIVALVALVVAIGGTASALPGRFSVGRDDLKTSSVGARAIGKSLTEVVAGARSKDPLADDGEFTESDGSVVCPARAPFAFDPSVGNMGPSAIEMRRQALPNKWGSPGGYRFVVLSDLGPEPTFTMRVNCLPER